ncbi:hypothetical protein K4A83_02800 [Spirulina subsalsa FACHB-351]|uniref:Carbon dioxide concentrating mechanism protein n=1 Tax=Spirulina subsalsa FACHB-351 TaxID=234711 RepID=A0ABT3L121_9CYAN|nr:hypothetical protein [Spirulina subsalsa]MCW6035201.1 hypothetical protein [Spirulina subsalsa FACHB-351]
MPLQPLQLVDTPTVRINGDVTIHPSAAIAPGVILQAAPQSQIIIAAGACIGMGVILNAYQGTIELETGVSLGPGVLIVGQCKIGANTCIGGATTIYNADVPALQVIPAGSLIGDPSRQVVISETPALESSPVESSTADSSSLTDDLWSEDSPPEEPPQWTEGELETTAPQPEAQEFFQDSEESVKPPGTPVFGKVYVNQLLLTLFPQGHSLNQRNGDEK